MSSINLVHRYIVQRIIEAGKTVKYSFRNNGGFDPLLTDRIMKTFAIPETGHLQAADTFELIPREEVIVEKITDFIVNKDFDDLIDLWKELCNKGIYEFALMSWSEIISNLLNNHGYVFYGFLHLSTPGPSVGYKTVDNALKAACDYCYKASTAKDLAQCKNYIEKLKTVLAGYPFIQEAFITKMFGSEYLDKLDGWYPILRTNKVIEAIQNRYHGSVSSFDPETQQKDKAHSQEFITDSKDYPDDNTYIRFMGTEHLIGPRFEYIESISRFNQEYKYIVLLLSDLIESDSRNKELVSTIKSIIHRSPNQKRLCHEILIDKEQWEMFDNQDPRKRSMLIDSILEIRSRNIPASPATADLEIPLEQNDKEKENMSPQQEVSVSAYLDVLKETNPDLYARIIADLNDPQGKEDFTRLVSNHINTVKLETTALPNGVTIEGDPNSDTVKQLIEIFNSSPRGLLNELKETRGEEPEQFDKFVSRIIRERLMSPDKRKDNEDFFTNLFSKTFPTLEIQLDSPQEECNDPECPVHGDKKTNLIQDLLKTKRPDGEELHPHQLRMADLVVGINPIKADGVSIVMPGGKTRQPHPFGEIFTLGDLQSVTAKGPFDFSGMVKFIKDHYDPEPKKPTVSEIETTTNVVINQSFIIYDVKGEFFCEYRMKWTPALTRFMFSHDAPGNEEGRQFHHIRDLTKRMTQDEAFKEFQSLRRVVITSGAHKPKPNQFISY